MDDTSRLDRSSKCELLWKPSVFIVLPIIRNQSKTKTIPDTEKALEKIKNEKYKKSLTK